MDRRVVTISLSFLALSFPLLGDVCLASLEDVPHEYTISIRSPNISLTNDNVFICVSADLPFGPDISYIEKIEFKPILGQHYHMLMQMCDQPAFRPDVRIKGPVAWDCGAEFFANPNPPLKQAGGCLKKGRHSVGSFGIQYQGGPGDEGSVILPPGHGIPVGGSTGHNTILVKFHFADRNKTIHGTTGVSGVDYTLVRRPAHQPKIVAGLHVSAYGFVGGNGIGRITGSWTHKQGMPDIRIIRLFTHWHDMATEVRVWIKRSDGVTDLLWRENPKNYSGVFNVSESAPSVLRPGDQLKITCTYNITLSHVVRIEDREMCALFSFYSVDGQEVLPIAFVSSYDARYRECFSNRLDLDFEVNFDADSSFNGSVPRDLCFL